MKNLQQEEQWVNEAINSFEGATRATANPFLITRIMERLRQQNSPWEKVANFIGKPAFAMAVIAIFVAANVYVATQEKAEKLAKEKQTNEQLFASEFTTSGNLSNELNPNR